MGMEKVLADLPAPVRDVLARFCDQAKSTLASDLHAVVLFGSAAEGRLRPTSDVNLILVLHAFAPEKVNGLRDALRMAHAAIRLEVMFLLESELNDASEAFAVKFGDILQRRRVLYGADPFAAITISRDAVLNRLRQSLMNLVLRLRERYALVSLREEQMAHVLADMAGPLRHCAATLAELENAAERKPKEALIALAARLPGGPFTAGLQTMSDAREGKSLPAGLATGALLEVLAIAEAMRERARGLR
jgi:predicted nucleotidyltransferase